MSRWACACCRCLTLTEEPSGSYEICPVCFWEQDDVQEADPTYWGGANVMSLKDAQTTYARIGAKEERVLSFVRPPATDELPS